MKSSRKRSIEILLLEINQNIEEYADITVKKMFEEKDFDFLCYPPNCGFTELEKQELLKLQDNEHLKNALRKVIANSSAGIVFDIFCLTDGVGCPKNDYENWTGLRIVNVEDIDEKILIEGVLEEVYLHDEFFEKYWDWKAIRGNKTWKLDTYDD